MFASTGRSQRLAACNGCILGAEQIRERLTSRPEEIFAPDTWTENNLGEAKYDLRIADTLLKVKNPDEEMLVVPPGKKRARPIILKPGGVAFVSTVEQLRLPWDLAANIGMKFHYVSRGILMLNGLHVDPGYGQSHIASETGGLPLFFVLANVATQDIEIVPSQSSPANLQFVKVCGEVLRSQQAPEAIIESVFDEESPHALGLGFFEEMTKVSAKMDRSIRNLEERVGHVERESRQRIDRVENSTLQVVQFGIFLISATLLGVSIASILQVINMDPDSDQFGALGRLVEALPQSWPQVIAFVSILFVLVLLTRLLIQVLGALFHSAMKAMKPRRPRGTGDDSGS